jgi:hypothetical protein
MTGPEDKDREGLERLDKALIEDILAASDDEILAEAREDGTDPEAVATAMRALFENTIAASRKARLAAAKAAVAADRIRPATDLPSDPMEARRLLERVLARQGDLTTAARKGGRGGTLSDEEVYGLLQDFRDVGISISDGSGDDK